MTTRPPICRQHLQSLLGLLRLTCRMRVRTPRIARALPFVELALVVSRDLRASAHQVLRRLPVEPRQLKVEIHHPRGLHLSAQQSMIPLAQPAVADTAVDLRNLLEVVRWGSQGIASDRQWGAFRS